MGLLCFQFTHFPCDYWENIYNLSYYHHQIRSVNYYPLLRVKSWNNGMRCMSFCILMDTHELVMQPQQSKAKRKKTCAHIFWKILHISIIFSIFQFRHTYFGEMILYRDYSVDVHRSVKVLPWAQEASRITQNICRNSPDRIVMLDFTAEILLNSLPSNIIVDNPTPDVSLVSTFNDCFP